MITKSLQTICISRSNGAMSVWKFTIKHFDGIIPYSAAFLSTTVKRFAKKHPNIVLPREPVSEKRLSRQFVDALAVRATGGNGGNGLKAFSSLKGKEWAGPDGGDGGNGGHVIIKATDSVTSLSNVNRVLVAQNGVDGKTKCQHGRNAEHLYISVPIGTLVKDKKTGSSLAELQHNNQQFILARGGAGGRGNHYYLSNEVRAPVLSEQGGRGECRELLLEMKIAAHIGLVGFPNAGKSTLLTALSRAKPKVADYPFTTLKPHIGMLRYSDGLQIAIADIPGLIEGSHMNKGLGISFLKHIEKCTSLLYVIDMSQPDPYEQLEKLKYELEKYKTHLSKRPHAVLANKIDLSDAETKVGQMQEKMTLPVIPVSGKEKINLDELKDVIRLLYERFSALPDSTP